MYLGRVSQEKNPQYFIDVVSHLHEQWVGVIVGPLVESDFSPVIKSELRERLVFSGASDDVAAAINAADVMLLASAVESGPIVLAEAWALRKPFFMRKTGLAAQHPDAVFIIGSLTVRARTILTQFPCWLAVPLLLT